MEIDRGQVGFGTIQFLSATATERLDEAARRVDRMLRELQQFGETVLVSSISKLHTGEPHASYNDTF